MDDLISRQEVIDLLKQLRKDGMMIPWEGKDVFKAIRALPSSKQEAQWIPCSERLPEEDGWYLTTYDGGFCGADGEPFSGMSEYENGQWVEDTVYAWMPFPEPYKENKT